MNRSVYDLFGSRRTIINRMITDDKLYEQPRTEVEDIKTPQTIHGEMETYMRIYRDGIKYVDLIIHKDDLINIEYISLSYGSQIVDVMYFTNGVSLYHHIYKRYPQNDSMKTDYVKCPIIVGYIGNDWNLIEHSGLGLYSTCLHIKSRYNFAYPFNYHVFKYELKYELNLPRIDQLIHQTQMANLSYISDVRYPLNFNHCAYDLFLECDNCQHIQNIKLLIDGLVLFDGNLSDLSMIRPGLFSFNFLNANTNTNPNISSILNTYFIPDLTHIITDYLVNDIFRYTENNNLLNWSRINNVEIQVEHDSSMLALPIKLYTITYNVLRMDQFRQFGLLFAN